VTDDNRTENARRELAKAQAAMKAARALAGLGMWDDCVSRAYYAAYHAATAALVSIGVQAKTHHGTQDLVFRFLVEPGSLSRRLSKDLAALQRYREQADYSAAISFDASTGPEEVDRAERVIAEVVAFLLSGGHLQS
jgi:uncharacterized protein (UPF0332 family)